MEEEIWDVERVVDHRIVSGSVSRSTSGYQAPRLASHSNPLLCCLTCCCGQCEFLVQWKGWPPEANTWEPLNNLVDVTGTDPDFGKAAFALCLPAQLLRKFYSYNRLPRQAEGVPRAASLYESIGAAA